MANINVTLNPDLLPNLLSDDGGGFLGAFTGAVMESQLTYGSFGQDVLDVAIASAVGGGISKLSGASFANGAWSAAFQQMFNAAEHGVSRLNQILDSKLKPNQVTISRVVAAEILNANVPDRVKFVAGQLTPGELAKARLILAAYSFVEKHFAVVRIMLHGYIGMAGTGNPEDFVIASGKAAVKVIWQGVSGGSHSVRVVIHPGIFGSTMKSRLETGLEYRAAVGSWLNSCPLTTGC